MSPEEFNERESVFVDKTEEKDKIIAENLQSRLEKINSFEPSGNIVDDYNNLLELAERDSLYKKVTADENPHIILAGLTGIKEAWENILKEPNKVDTTNEAKKLSYIDVPQAEIEAINKLINFYLNKFSGEEKNNNENKQDFSRGEREPLIRMQNLLEMAEEAAEEKFTTTDKIVSDLQENIDKARLQGVDLSQIDNFEERVKKLRIEAPLNSIEGSMIKLRQARDSKVSDEKIRDKESAMASWYWNIREKIDKYGSTLEEDDEIKIEKELNEVAKKLGIK